MALALVETEAGRAMLINAAMRQADMGRLLDHGEFFRMMLEPWPHWVHYRAPRKPSHCPPDTFGFIGKYRLTDCDWIVPGTC